MGLLLLLSRVRFDPSNLKRLFDSKEDLLLFFLVLAFAILAYSLIVKPLLSHMAKKKKSKSEIAEEPPKFTTTSSETPNPQIYKNVKTGKLWAIKTDSDGNIVAACPIRQHMGTDELKFTNLYNDQLRAESDQLVLL
jgi:hypothetical protein